MKNLKLVVKIEYKYGEKERLYISNRPQYKITTRLLKNYNWKNKKVVDLGCGVGEFSEILLKKGANVVSIDGNKYKLNKLNNFFQIDIEHEKIPVEDNSQDVVISTDVIEHLWNTEFFLNEIKRIVKKNGVIIITTPNYNFFLNRFWYIVGCFEKIVYKSRHKKFYTYKSIKDELNNHFDIVDENIITYKYKSIKKFKNFFGRYMGFKLRYDLNKEVLKSEKN
jgi:2-polyprenyl-3-methyl-5-hydroxy-6-metoxy-1,4-benzoquinol methylase